MSQETNRIEYKQHLSDDLGKEAIAFLNYHEGGIMYVKQTSMEVSEQVTEQVIPQVRTKLRNKYLIHIK